MKKNNVIKLALIAALSFSMLAGCTAAGNTTGGASSVASSKAEEKLVPDNILEILPEIHSRDSILKRHKNYKVEATIYVKDKDISSIDYVDDKIIYSKQNDTELVNVKSVKAGYMDGAEYDSPVMLYYLGNRFDSNWDNYQSKIFGYEPTEKVVKTEKTGENVTITTEFDNPDKVKIRAEALGNDKESFSKVKTVVELNKDNEIVHITEYILGDKEYKTSEVSVKYDVEAMDADPDFIMKVHNGVTYTFIAGPGTDKEVTEQLVINDSTKFSIYFPDEYAVGVYADKDFKEPIDILDGTITTVYIKYK